MNSEEYVLDNNDIGRAMEAVESYLSSNNVERSEIIRTSLAAEDILLNYMDRFGSNVRFQLKTGKKYGSMRVELGIICSEYDPFSDVDNDEVNIVHNLMNNAGLEPSWVFRNGANRILFMIRTKRKISVIAQILTAFFGGIGIGLISLNSPDSPVAVILDKILNPVSDTIMEFLTAAAIVLVFLSVTNGICNMGDISTFNSIGKKTVSRFLIMLAVLGMLAYAIVLPFFDIKTGAEFKLNLDVFVGMIMDIVPANLVEPFVSGNMMQIIFIAICIGFFLLKAGDKANGIKELIGQGNTLFQILVEAIIKLLPIVVFVSIYNITAVGETKVILSSIKIIVMYFAVEVVILSILLCRVCILRHVNPVLLLKKMMPSLLIVLATASSIAAYPKTMEILKKDYGIDSRLTDFGVPLGQSIFTPEDFSNFVCVSLCMAEVYNVDITPGWLITLGITAYFMAIACPPVAGALLSCMSLLFAQLGIPIAAIAIIAAIDPVIDRIATFAMQFTIHTEMIMLGSSLNLLDENVLRS